MEIEGKNSYTGYLKGTIVKKYKRTPIVLVHGGWAGGWQWTETAEKLIVNGYSAFTPTLTGLGDRVHLASPEVDINTYINDVKNVFIYEELADVILVGFSYSGLVVTGLAEVVPERIRHIIYVDAFIPKNGQSLEDIVGERISVHFHKFAHDYGNGWLVPSFFENDPRLTAQPIKTSTTPLTVANPLAETVPRTYIKCTAKDPSWSFTPILDEASRYAQSMGWGYKEIESDHFPMDHAQENLLRMIIEIAEEQAK
jgi:pimeloyl-ACP methyl ester carboxylesterase